MTPLYLVCSTAESASRGPWQSNFSSRLSFFITSHRRGRLRYERYLDNRKVRLADCKHLCDGRHPFALSDLTWVYIAGINQAHRPGTQRRHRIMTNFTLRGQNQKRIGRVLLFLSPFFLFHEIINFIKFTFLPAQLNAPTPMSLDFWFFVGWWILLILVGYAFSGSVKIKDGMISFANLGGYRRIPLSKINEVAGDEGDVTNDFNESLIITFDTERENDGLVLPVKDYDEQELRTFISAIKEANPHCKYSYTDVIPFESRGLIKFLLNANESESLTVKLSKTPTEDAIFHLIKTHEKTFWCVYFFFWIVLLGALSYYCYALNAEWSQHPGIMPQWTSSGRTEELVRMFRAATSGDAPNYIHAIGLLVLLFFQILLDYFSTAGLPVLTVIWLVTSSVMVVFMPLLRAWSPAFIFIDPKTIGMRMSFLNWIGITDVDLVKFGEMADPLDGKLTLVDGALNRLDIDLTKVSDAQTRQRILRLVDRYAVKARFNDEFMRTSNTLFDIQFTDLWLEEKGTETAQSERELDYPESLRNGAYLVKRLLGYGGQGVTYLATPATANSGGTAPSAEDAERAESAKAAEGVRVPESADVAETANGGADVVIKELVLPNYADVRIMQDATSRFNRGASLLAELVHPQIVKLLDHFVENGKAYLVMEYVEGKTLRRVVEEKGPFSLEKVRQLGLQICDILSFLHERESPVIHCDLAPDNLILAPDGKVKLIDFDVARVVDSRSHTFIAGRPSYTPPEQFRGRPTTQSDIFALGAILHFLLRAEDPPPLCAGVTDEIIDEERSSDSATAKIEELIRKCAGFEAEERPASAREVRAVLEAALDDMPDKSAKIKIKTKSAVLEVE